MALTHTERRAYFKQDLQLHKTWQLANSHCNNCTFYTAPFDFATAQIVINCTLKYASCCCYSVVSLNASVFTDCLKQFGSLLSHLQPCALPHHILRFAQGLWRYLVTGSTTISSSHEVHYS